MRIAVGGDHNGFAVKNGLVALLEEAGHQVLDIGPESLDSADDYPDFADAMASLVTSGKVERGIMICGSGVGASMAANKVPGIRAAVCHDIYSAHQGVEHDDINVLCLGTRIIGWEVTKELVTAFVSARFSGEPRHKRRLEKVRTIENRAQQPGS